MLNSGSNSPISIIGTQNRHDITVIIVLQSVKNHIRIVRIVRIGRIISLKLQRVFCRYVAKKR